MTRIQRGPKTSRTKYEIVLVDIVQFQKNIEKVPGIAVYWDPSHEVLRYEQNKFGPLTFHPSI